MTNGRTMTPASSRKAGSRSVAALNVIRMLPNSGSHVTRAPSSIPKIPELRSWKKRRKKTC